MADNLSVSQDGKKARLTGKGLGHHRTSVRSALPATNDINKVKFATTIVKTTTYKFDDDEGEVKLNPGFDESKAEEINNKYVKLLENEKKARKIHSETKRTLIKYTAEEKKYYDDWSAADKRLELVKKALSEPYTPNYGTFAKWIDVPTYPDYLAYLRDDLADEKRDKNILEKLWKSDNTEINELKEEIAEVKKIKKIGESALVEAQENYDRLKPIVEKIREKYAPINADWTKSRKDAIEASDAVYAYRKLHYYKAKP